MFAALKEGLKVAKRHGMDTGKLIAAGQSAGAQLVSLLAYDRDELARHKLSQKMLRGLVLVSGPLDFSRFEGRAASKLLRDFAGDEENTRKADPIRYVRGDEGIPVRCIHGEKDPLVGVEQPHAFARKANRMKDVAEVHVVEGGHHADLARLFIDETETTDLLVGWVDEKMAS